MNKRKQRLYLVVALLWVLVLTATLGMARVRTPGAALVHTHEEAAPAAPAAEEGEEGHGHGLLPVSPGEVLIAAGAREWFHPTGRQL